MINAVEQDNSLKVESYSADHKVPFFNGTERFGICKS
jgi:hypothetical protein